MKQGVAAAGLLLAGSRRVSACISAGLKHTYPVVAAGVQPPIKTWRPIFEGKSLKVFERASPPHLHVTDGEPLGSSAVSG